MARRRRSPGCSPAHSAPSHVAPRNIQAGINPGGTTKDAPPRPPHPGTLRRNPSRQRAQGEHRTASAPHPNACLTLSARYTGGYGDSTFPSFILVAMICRLCWMRSISRSHSSISLCSCREAFTWTQGRGGQRSGGQGVRGQRWDPADSASRRHVFIIRQMASVHILPS